MFASKIFFSLSLIVVMGQKVSAQQRNEWLKQNLCTGHLIDETPDMLQRIAGPSTLKLYRPNTSKDLPVLVIDIKNTNSAIIQSTKERKDLKDLSLSEAEGLWGKSAIDQQTPSVFNFLFNTEEKKRARLKALVNRENIITNYQLTVDGVGTTSWYRMK